MLPVVYNVKNLWIVWYTNNGSVRSRVMFNDAQIATICAFDALAGFSS